MIPPKVIGSVAELPEYGYGPRTIMWWGVLAFMMMEASAFLLAIFAYFFIAGQYDEMPPGGFRPPDHLWGAVFTVVAVLSLIPNFLAEHAARKQDQKGVQLALIALTLFVVALIAVRFVEFTHLNVRWDANAYGSIVWALMLLHLTHILTDFGDTFGLTLFVHTHEFDEGRYSDVTDNCLYWNFVVLTWLPIYATVYWAPRLM